MSPDADSCGAIKAWIPTFQTSACLQILSAKPQIFDRKPFLGKALVLLCVPRLHSKTCRPQAEGQMIGAVDIGGTKIAVAAVTETGEINCRREWRTADYSPVETVSRIALTLRDLANSQGKLSGAGI